MRIANWSLLHYAHRLIQSRFDTENRMAVTAVAIVLLQAAIVMRMCGNVRHNPNEYATTPDTQTHGRPLLNQRVFSADDISGEGGYIRPLP